LGNSLPFFRPGEYTVDDVTNTGPQVFGLIVVGDGGTASARSTYR